MYFFHGAYNRSI